MSNLEHGLDVLESLARRGRMSLVEIAGELGTSRATAFRVVASLRERGYINHDRGARVYGLGDAVGELASSVGAPRLVQAAAPAMTNLVHTFRETVCLAALRHNRLVYLSVHEGDHTLRVSETPGTIAPAHSTALGKAILAGLDPKGRTALLGDEPYRKLTARTITSRQALDRELRHVGERGYAVDNEETDIGCLCFASAITGADGRPLGGMSISGLAARIPAARRSKVGSAVKVACREVSIALNGARA